MTTNFTPQFFARPVTTTMTAATATTSTPVTPSAQGAADDSEQQKHYSAHHGAPKYASPFSSQTSPLSNANQRYADIDWVNGEAITQDGERHKFGSPRFSK
ncbi:MAG: hypothetical protein LBQ11_01985 [Candidatus Nomurabacteria bacterium]|jgi:hypothetical protein|nr:hypothetical protein [Candidatus Nomurabacteria bacterium]